MAVTAHAARGTILVVDDDGNIRHLVTTALENEGFHVVEASNGMEALERFDKDKPDLVLLDVMMPVISGLEVLQHIRHKDATPVMLLTGLGSEDNRVTGLQLGADDYMVKPFSVRELAARAIALLRRSGMTAATCPTIEYPGLSVDLTGREVWVDGALVELTAKEFDLLAFLAAAPGRVVTRRQLLRDVWGSSTEWQQEGTVTEHVRRLRQRIEMDPENPRWIQTVRGVGYRFDRRSRNTAAPPAHLDAERQTDSRR
jgi:DNA-binding response OmpR family regulator